MPPKKKKAPFNPFVRLAEYTTPCAALPASLQDPQTQLPQPAEFIDTALTIIPPVPRTEVRLRIQFRCTVDVVPGDTVTITLPGFRGPPARAFSLDPMPHPDGLNMARYFQAYWSGDNKGKGRGKNGVPAKQVLLLRCVKVVPETTLVCVGVPAALFLVAPDKLAGNSVKVKIEAKLRYAEGGKVPKQAFLSCTEVKKMPIVEELETYEKVMGHLVESAGLSKEERFVGEELGLDEVEQVWQAAQTQRPCPVAMPFIIFPLLFGQYEDAGGFVKLVIENALAFAKQRDPVAVHREVAKNWGVRVSAVVLLEDVLVLRCAALYPKLPRTTLLVAHLLTMEPVDVGRMFSVTSLPKCSILLELQSALRAQGTIGTSRDASEEVSLCERLLAKWPAVLSTLLLATVSVDDDDEENGGAAGEGHHGGNRGRDGENQNEGAGAGVGGRESPTHPSPAVAAMVMGGPAHTDEAHRDAATSQTALLPPPPLFLGVRDVNADALQHLRERQAGDWFMLPGLAVARQSFPLLLSESAAGDGDAGGGGGGTAAKKAGDEDAEEEETSVMSSAGLSVPENAVVFELHNVVECLELADLSAHPYSREWLLPFSSSYRVRSVSVRRDLNELTHVVLDMTGSLMGDIVEELIPEGDRGIAAVVTRKLRMQCEYAEPHLTAIAQFAYVNAKCNERRRLHPPTLMRAQYLAQFREAEHASVATQSVETGSVVWQVCTHPPQTLAEGVVKPSTWEAIPKKYAPAVEMFFLGRSRSKTLLSEGTGLVLNLADFTIDYGGKGPRPVRRVVDRRVTHEPPYTDTMEQLQDRVAETARQLQVLNRKLGITTTVSPGGNGTNTAASADGGAGSKKKKAAPASAKAVSTKG